MLQILHWAHDILFRKLIFSFGQEFIMIFLHQKRSVKEFFGFKEHLFEYLIAQGGSEDYKKVGILGS